MSETPRTEREKYLDARVEALTARIVELEREVSAWRGWANNRWVDWGGIGRIVCRPVESHSLDGWRGTFEPTGPGSL